MALVFRFIQHFEEGLLLDFPPRIRMKMDEINCISISDERQPFGFLLKGVWLHSFGNWEGSV